MPSEQLELGDDEQLITLKQAWMRALGVMSNKINKASFESFLRPIRPLSYTNGEATLGVPSPFARDMLRRYHSLIQSTLAEALGAQVSVRLVVSTLKDITGLGETHAADVSSREESKPAPNQRRVSPEPGPPLIARYTFDNFVVGKSNRLAHAGALAVAASPGTVYNPLFIYGGSGLGKTHLLHAIGHAARTRDPHIRLGLVDGESFTAQYVSALREHRTEEFRRQNRRVDIWLVDDIQSIAGREQTKEEFFHTFNALYQTGKQIVIASDRSPRELRAMEERLRSRFECGLIADINPPELETRVAILEKRCAMENPPWQVPGEVIYLIAEAIQSNMRALEGALTRLVAYSSVMNLPCTVEMAQSVLSEFFISHGSLPRPPSKDIAVEAILRAVSNETRVSMEALLSPRRDKPTATARQIAMYLSRELTDAPLAQIGAAIGGRDHTTVQRAIAKIESLLPYDTALRALVQGLRNKLER